MTTRKASKRTAKGTARAPRRAPSPSRRPPPDWRTDPRLWEPHVDGYRHRRAVERAARKHGAALGDNFCALLAARLTVVDTHGGRLTPQSAHRTVAGWAREGTGSPRC